MSNQEQSSQSMSFIDQEAAAAERAKAQDQSLELEKRVGRPAFNPDYFVDEPEAEMTDIEWRSQFTTAALEVHAQRLQYGNGSAYDRALCEWSGSPEHFTEFAPIYRQSEKGVWRGYNNPNLRESGYTEDGFLIEVRHADNYGPRDKEEDPNSEYFVGVLDLNTGETIDMRILKVEDAADDSVIIDLTDRPPKSGAGESTLHPDTELDPMDATRAVIAARKMAHSDNPNAYIVLNGVRGNTFIYNGERQELSALGNLVKEVNELAEGDELNLDQLRLDSYSRQYAA